MNKRVAPSLFALLLVVSRHPAFSQNVGGGGRIGPAFTTFGGEQDTDWKTGFTVGGFFSYNLSEVIGVRPELSYVRKGASWPPVGVIQGPIEIVTLETTVDLDYLELQVPVTLMTPAHRSGVRARVYAGPTVALELNCGAEWRFEGEAPSLGVESSTLRGRCEDESPFGERLFTSTKSLDFGLLVGAGIDVAIGNGAITGDLRYGLGLTNINEGNRNERPFGSIKNRAFEILLGYLHYMSD